MDGRTANATLRSLKTALGLHLLLILPAFSEEIPSGTVWTRQEQNNWVHIYKNPSYDEKGKHTVLVLGLNSSADVVKEQSGYVNPATGRPYDVVIGLAAPGTYSELQRVFWKDHFDARENAGAVGAAIAKAFDGKIDAATVDMHSNGNSVGIALLEKNLGFTGVTRLNMMAPDEGFEARNLDPDRLSGIVAAHHINAIDVYINSGDVVPKAGNVSKELADLLAFENVSAKGVPIRGHDFDYRIPLSLGDHYLASYLVLRALESGDPGVIESMRKSVGEDTFQAVASVVTPTGSFGAKIRKRSEELKMQEDVPRALIGDLEANLGEIRRFQAGLSQPGDQALMDEAGRFSANDQVLLLDLRDRVASIERALECLAQIIDRPAEEPNETYHPPPQPPAQLH